MSITIAKTKYGEIRGAELTGKYAGITTFRSVPYAQPPVGELRFRDPVEQVPWTGVLDATHFAPRPYQAGASDISVEPWATDFYYDGNPPMSEDCLYMQITTGAASPDEKRPVFIWFHGGGLGHGYYNEIEFDPSELARKGIVVVSVGQRLNAFGYLCLPQLAEEQGGVCGNYGLKDEFMALKFVRENIAGFGGDPGNITVGGQSGGTAKSTSLATSPKSQGMIRRCINESNLAWMRDYLTLEDAYERGRAYLENIGLDPDISLEELRRVPARCFYNMKEAPKGMGAKNGLPGQMVCDGIYIANTSAEKNMAEYGGKIDYLSGGNEGESYLGGAMLSPGPKFATAAEFYGYMKELLGDLYDKYDFEKIWPVTDENAYYMSRVLASRGFSGGIGIMSGVMTNRYFGAWRAAHAPGARTFSYTFGHYTPSLPEEKGTFRDKDNLLAWHSSELWYTFASLREGTPPARPWTEEDFRLAEMASSYWANFIATGDPNGTDSECNALPYWPESRDNWGWMYLKAKPEGRDGLDELDKLLLEYLERNYNYPKI